MSDPYSVEELYKIEQQDFGYGQPAPQLDPLRAAATLRHILLWMERDESGREERKVWPDA